MKRFMRAGESSFLPKSPPGFIVPIIWKFSCPTTTSTDLLLFSARVTVFDCSRTLRVRGTIDGM